MCDLCRDKDKIVVDVEELKTNDLLVLGNRGLTCISESGLYRILAKCNLPKCEPFESWVFDEVLLPCNAKRAGPCAQQAVRFVASRTAFFLFICPQFLYKRHQHAGDTPNYEHQPSGVLGN